MLLACERCCKQPASSTLAAGAALPRRVWVHRFWSRDRCQWELSPASHSPRDEASLVLSAAPGVGRVRRHATFSVSFGCVASAWYNHQQGQAR